MFNDCSACTNEETCAVCINCISYPHVQVGGVVGVKGFLLVVHAGGVVGVRVVVSIAGVRDSVGGVVGIAPTRRPVLHGSMVAVGVDVQVGRVITVLCGITIKGIRWDDMLVRVVTARVMVGWTCDGCEGLSGCAGSDGWPVTQYVRVGQSVLHVQCVGIRIIG